MKKRNSQFSISIEPWMDSIITEMAHNTGESKNTIINELLRSKLSDLGYSRADALIDRLKKPSDRANNDQKLLG